MATVDTIIKRSLFLIGVIEPGEDPSAEDASTGLDGLNEMLHGWRKEGIDLNHVTATLGDTLRVDDSFSRASASTWPSGSHRNTARTCRNGCRSARSTLSWPSRPIPWSSTTTSRLTGLCAPAISASASGPTTSTRALVKIPFATHAYQARALPFSAQRMVNYFLERDEGGGKNDAACYNAPGTKAFATGLAGALRGSRLMGGIVYIVAGNVLYSVTSGGTATSLGSINTYVGLVGMAVNRATNNELCIVDGTEGWTYDTVNGLRQITDANFSAADTVAFLDGYFIFNKKGTPQFFISNLDNGRVYTATDFAEAEASPDDIVTVFVNGQQLWIFKETIIEVYYNSGDTDFPFERISGAVLERGCAAAFAIAEDDNTLFWLGEDRIVYRANGFTPLRISTHAIEAEMEKMSSVSDAYAFFVTMAGHKFLHLTFPTGQKTFVYDAAMKLWHERESFGARYWRGVGYVDAYDKHLIGDAFQGRMGELDMDTFDEYGGTMQGIVAGPVIHDDRRGIRHKRFELDIESGVGTTTGAEPQMWMDYSDDGGHTWSMRKPFRSMGKIGKYRTRLRWTRLGRSRERIYRVTTADAVKRSILAAHLNPKRAKH